MCVCVYFSCVCVHTFKLIYPGISLRLLLIDHQVLVGHFVQHCLSVLSCVYVYSVRTVHGYLNIHPVDYLLYNEVCEKLLGLSLCHGQPQRGALSLLLDEPLSFRRVRDCVTVCMAIVFSSLSLSD